MANDEWEKMESDKTFWSPKAAGEELQGEVVEIAQGMYGSRYTIRTDKGDITLPSHKMLQSRLHDAAIGDIVKVVYTGEQPPKVRGENPLKVYDVFRKKGSGAPAVKTEHVQ